MFSKLRNPSYTSSYTFCPRYFYIMRKKGKYILMWTLDYKGKWSSVFILLLIGAGISGTSAFIMGDGRQVGQDLQVLKVPIYIS